MSYVFVFEIFIVTLAKWLTIVSLWPMILPDQMFYILLGILIKLIKTKKKKKKEFPEGVRFV